MKIKKTYKIIVLSTLLFAFLAVPILTLAQVAEPNIFTGLNAVGENAGLRRGTLPDFIATMIRWVLGLIGVILVALFVYGGVMYATSAGSEEKIETGKRIMTYTIIGVVIIVAAFIISEYIIRALFAGSP